MRSSISVKPRWPRLVLPVAWSKGGLGRDPPVARVRSLLEQIASGREDKLKALANFLAVINHQSEYLVPSRAVAWDLE